MDFKNIIGAIEALADLDYDFQCGKHADDEPGYYAIFYKNDWPVMPNGVQFTWDMYSHAELLEDAVNEACEKTLQHWVDSN